MECNDNELIKLVMIASLKLESVANHFFLQPLGLSLPAVQIMGIIEHQGNVTPTQIKNQLGSSKSNVTQRLNALEERGLVTRQEDKNNDKRSINVVLTAAGKKKMRIIKQHMLDYNAHIEKNFPKEEIASAAKSLKKFISILDECSGTANCSNHQR